MNKISAMSNPRKGNGDLGNFYCANCGSSSGAYIQLKEKETYGQEEFYRDKGLICKNCLLVWVEMINKSILEQCKPKTKDYDTKCINVLN